MFKLLFVFLVSSAIFGSAREPFRPHSNTIAFLVYYTSRYRGICVGMFVARSVVLSAAVCVTNPLSAEHDRRPINVIVGSHYRHARRGIRVPITHLIIPRLPTDDLPYRANMLEKSPVVMMMKWRVADMLVEVPPRALKLDWIGDSQLTLLEECFIGGWHFFYDGDIVYPGGKFLLQRNLRVQFVNLVKMDEWCDALQLKLQKALSHVGYHGAFSKTDMVCIKDPDEKAQSCHGMYGAPLICQGHAVGIISAPDAQWTNCTGFSNIVHLFRGSFLHAFMTCISKLFEPDISLEWERMKKAMYDENEYEVHYYDRMLTDDESSSASREHRF